MTRECIDILTQLESWYARPGGRYLLDTTRDALQRALDTAFGYHIVQLGFGSAAQLLEGSPINHRIYAAGRPGPGVTLVAEACELPLDSDSIDTVVAHHSLEFCPDPHRVLREIQRVLTPQGHLLLVGFNPYSLQGINTRLRGLSRASLWHGHRPVSENRLTEWLHLLGCEVQHSTRLYSVPPVGRGRLWQYLARCDQWNNSHNLPLGGVYILHAIKQVGAMHPPRRQLRSPARRLIGLAVPKASPTPTMPAPGSPVSREGDVAA